MSAQILDLVPRKSVDEAWESFAEYARRLAEDPALICDRQFQEEMARRHEAWKRLFMAMEPCS